MPPLHTRCPNTQQWIGTGIDIAPESLAKVWSTWMKIECPHCSETHGFWVREAYVNGAISDEILGGLELASKGTARR
jgi:hypothetical protein